MTVHIIKRFNNADHEGNPYIHHHCLEQRKGQVNWVAIVKWLPGEPGNMKRTFLKRNKLGTMFLVPKELTVGHILEFGADRVTKKYRHLYREYFHVDERDATCLLLQETKTVQKSLSLPLVK